MLHDGVGYVTNEVEYAPNIYVPVADRMAQGGESPASISFGVDEAVVPVFTGDQEGETPFSEYFLYHSVP